MIPCQHWSAQRLLLACAGLFVFLAACAPSATPIPIATQPLSPILQSPSPEPATPSPTPDVLPGAADLQGTPTLSALQVLFEIEADIDERLIRRELDDLAEVLGIHSNRIQVVDAERATWRTVPLRCQLSEIARTTVEGVLTRLLVGDALHYYFSRDGVNFVACQGTERASNEVLIAVDPVAAEMLLLAQQRVAQTLDLPQSRVMLVEILPVTWDDTSLGCPQPGQVYSPATINGYRIVVTAGGQNFSFHSDSVALLACTLPDA